VRWLKWLRVPRDPKDLFMWLVTQAVLSLGLGSILGYAGLLVVVLALFGFMVGDYKGNGIGSVTASGVTLGAGDALQNRVLLTHYDEVASSWQRGLTPNQIERVESEQVDLPGAVLLAIGKMENNFQVDNAHLYYDYLKPNYTWQTFTDVSITYQEKTRRVGRELVTTCVSHETDTPVTLLMTAQTWDGSLTNSYKWVDTGTKGCNGTWTHKVQFSSSHRMYDWSEVWNLFDHVRATSGMIKNTNINHDTLAGLIGSVDFGLSDPYVQTMVDMVLFPNGNTLGVYVPVAGATADDVHNVVRWQAYINASAAKYQVPAVLIAGVMFQESHGLQKNAAGQLLTSSTGAIGLMQVEPSTAAGMNLNGVPLGANALSALSNPITNIELGAMYLSEMYHQFGGDPVEAEAAYNAGPGAVNMAIEQGGKVPPYTQTEDYVTLIQNDWIPLLQPYFGSLPNVQ